MAELPPGASATPVSRYVGTRAGAQSGSPAAALQHRASLSKHTSQPTQPLKMRCVHAAEGRCLSREGGSGNTRQRRWRGRECGGNTQGKGSVVAARAVGTRGKGGVLAARAAVGTHKAKAVSSPREQWEHRGKGGVLAARAAVGTLRAKAVLLPAAGHGSFVRRVEGWYAWPLARLSL